MYYYYYYYYYYYLLTAVGLSSCGSSPTLVQTKIKIDKTSTQKICIDHRSLFFIIHVYTLLTRVSTTRVTDRVRLVAVACNLHAHEADLERRFGRFSKDRRFKSRLKLT
jgi:hypothetical protein